MARFRIETPIAAPIEVCFDLARDVDFHTRSLEGTGERARPARFPPAVSCQHGRFSGLLLMRSVATLRLAMSWLSQFCTETRARRGLQLLAPG